MTRKPPIQKSLWSVLTLAWGVLLSGCSWSPEPAGAPVPTPAKPGKGLVLTDALGRRVYLQEPARRLVSLWPNATEMVGALGLEDRLVGITNWCNYPPSVKDKEVIGDPNTPRIEKIVELEPDLVLTPYGTSQEVVQQMERLGLPIFGLNPKTLDEVFTAMRQIGQLTGTSEKAEGIVKALEARVAAVEQKIQEPPGAKGRRAVAYRPRVYLEMYASDSEIITFGPNNYAHDLLERAGGHNVFADAEAPYPQVSAEQVLERNPDFIILAHHQAAAKDVLTRPGWSSLTAVKQQHVYRYPNPDEFLRPGPRLVPVLEWLARILHPDRFGSED